MRPPGGLLSLLASIVPTRVLVLLNAVGDEDLTSAASVAEVRDDVAVEAHAAAQCVPAPPGAPGTAPGRAAGPLGRLLAVRIPRPRPGERMEVNLISLCVRLASALLGGAVGSGSLSRMAPRPPRPPRCPSRPTRFTKRR